SKEDHWAVVLEPEWLPLLSKSMLGEPIEFGEPGADDLLKELANQAYGAVRTQLSSAGVQFPEVDIALMGADDELGGHKFSPVLFEVSFEITIDDEVLKGFALFPEINDDPGAIAPAEADEEDLSIGDLDIEMDEPSEETAPSETSPTSDAATGSAGDSDASKPSVQVQQAAFPDLGGESIGGDGSNTGFELLAEVELEVTVELGRRNIPLADVLRLTTGSVIELEKLVGEPLEVYANGRLIAEGEAVVMDEQFGIRITNLANGRPRAKAFV
ncbi:MAG: flagellar motor switch protein FliN, partial [Rhodothermales bacterium]